MIEIESGKRGWEHLVNQIEWAKFKICLKRYKGATHR